MTVEAAFVTVTKSVAGLLSNRSSSALSTSAADASAAIASVRLPPAAVGRNNVKSDAFGALITCCSPSVPLPSRVVSVVTLWPFSFGFFRSILRARLISRSSSPDCIAPPGRVPLPSARTAMKLRWALASASATTTSKRPVTSTLSRWNFDDRVRCGVLRPGSKPSSVIVPFGVPSNAVRGTSIESSLTPVLPTKMILLPRPLQASVVVTSPEPTLLMSTSGLCRQARTSSAFLPYFGSSADNAVLSASTRSPIVLSVLRWSIVIRTSVSSTNRVNSILSVAPLTAGVPIAGAALPAKANLVGSELRPSSWYAASK